MEATLVSLDHDLVILGSAVRTSPATAAVDIPHAWQQFMASGLLDTLPRLPSHPALYAVYCDYECDERGPYTMVLGVAVAPGTEARAGLRRVTIPAGEYGRLDAAGDPAEVIWRAWAYVNTVWPARGTRRYITDYERYPLAMLRPDYADAEVCVGLRRSAPAPR
jgi:predicted transcriptional regulator YdeE